MNKLVSGTMMMGCLVAIGVGLLAFFNLGIAFKRWPTAETRALYNVVFFAPFTLLFCVYFIHFWTSLIIGSRLWLSSICLGASLMCAVLIIPSGLGVVGHDFGHVLYGGCFESVAMHRAVGLLSCMSVIASCVLVRHDLQPYVLRLKARNLAPSHRNDEATTTTSDQ